MSAEEFDAQKKAIGIIIEAADHLCKNIPLYSSSNGTELSFEGKAELNEIVKKVIGAGITGAAKYEKKESQGVLQTDLATLLKDNTNCRTQVWHDLQGKLIAPYQGSSDPVPGGDAPSPNDYVKLGLDLPPIAYEDCRTPTFATGSAWQVGQIKINNQNYESAYFCNLFSAGVGSLDFVLGKSYRELRVTIGVADDPLWPQHRVRFEIIGDDRGHLDDPVTLKLGETRDLKVDVMDISRLKLKITELSSGASDSPSKPVWANPIVVPFRSHTARATRP